MHSHTYPKKHHNTKRQRLSPLTTPHRPLKTRSSTRVLSARTSPHCTAKRHLFGLFNDKSRSVVYELSQSPNPLTLRTTIIPTNYKFPNYILPSIDIVSTLSQQIVTPHYDELCYVIDKTPKVLQLPTISAVSNDSKFVNIFAEVTLCVTNGQKFSLIGDNFLHALQSLCETGISNVVSTVSEGDLLDKQYEEFILTKSHEELQRLFEDIGMDVLKVVVVPQQLDLTNVAAQLNLVKTMNELSNAITTNTNGNNILSDIAHRFNRSNNQLETDQAQDLNQLLSLLMNHQNAAHLSTLRATHQDGLNDPIETNDIGVENRIDPNRPNDVVTKL